MIDKSNVIAFFDRFAPSWDENQIINCKTVNLILDNAEVTEGKSVLDVACGTGVLIPFYNERKVYRVTGVDISPKMIEIAKKKYESENIRFYVTDAEEKLPAEMYDNIVIYNAFPHFSSPDKLISRLVLALKPGGTLTVAHGMSREAIDKHHNGVAKAVSNGLCEASELALLFEKHLEVTTVISNDLMYQVVGKKTDKVSL